MDTQQITYKIPDGWTAISEPWENIPMFDGSTVLQGVNVLYHTGLIVHNSWPYERAIAMLPEALAWQYLKRLETE